MQYHESNTGYGPGYSAGDITEAFRAAISAATEESWRNGFPVARYDAAKKRVYFEYADGKREVPKMAYNNKK